MIVEPGTAGEAVDTLTGSITSSITLSADTLYVLSGFVKVANGATLTIEPGRRSSATPPSRAARSSFYAVPRSTPRAPRTLRSSSPRAAEGARAPGDWGGLVIIGNGIINRSGELLTKGRTASPRCIRAVPTTRTTAACCATSGSSSPDTTSPAARGRSSTASRCTPWGRGTTLEFVQSLAGLDDSFEWFGGAVDGRYLVSYESGDDHFDWTEGYRGRNQFLIGFQTTRSIRAAGRRLALQRSAGLRDRRLQWRRLRRGLRPTAVHHPGVRQLHPGRQPTSITHVEDRAIWGSCCAAAPAGT